MCYDNNGASFTVELFEQLQDLETCLGIEITRRFIGEYDRGIRHDGPGQGHSLPLAPRELAGLVMHAIAQAHRLQRGLGLVAAAVAPRVEEGQFDILEGADPRDEVEGLKDEADLPVPNPREFIVTQI